MSWTIEGENIMPAVDETIDQVKSVEKYKYGFVTDIEAETAPRGLAKEIIHFISRKKNEPKWLLEWRLKAFERWLDMKEPDWAMIGYPIDYQDDIIILAPKT